MRNSKQSSRERVKLVAKLRRDGIIHGGNAQLANMASATMADWRVRFETDVSFQLARFLRQMLRASTVVSGS